jgi:hypothetical protein
MHHDGSQGDSGAAVAFEGTHKTGPVDAVIELTLRQHGVGQGPFILHGVLLNNDMALWMTAVESQVQQAVEAASIARVLILPPNTVPW